MKRHVLILSGGISQDSLNKKLMKTLMELAPKDFQFETFDITRLPFFSQDLEKPFNSVAQELKNIVQRCDAVVFVTPEYNRSFPGVLKNAIDWASRPYGQNAWNGKLAAVIGASIGNIGTFGAQHHLRQVLAYVNMHVMAQPEAYLNAGHAFDEKGNLKDESLRKLLQNYWQSFEAFIDRHSQQNSASRPREAEAI